ncbi:uncharacterized protein LOC121981152 [Zingiber officinale]|uniref:Peptidase S9 prolyl oligopeptidase catalytic domain-containing protein n=1 Tax=Zingiber officinale TaxID=94328 RepID=A0A8J5GPC3_ZINOF|nr:uncharacterized protein LOC121981152 [Zingiber officinale]XP_042389463.1 uncharacterized protein LOC121981152 [Zingiber officinale]KAG6507528.1 hypothetical protein ZIOFF_032878 [Zingiber officinale]
MPVGLPPTAPPTTAIPLHLRALAVGAHDQIVFPLYKYRCGARALSSLSRRTTMEATTYQSADDQLRTDFLQILRSRRRKPDVSLSVELGGPVMDPMYQAAIYPGSREVMEACHRENLDGFKDRVIEENIYLTVEEGEQGRLPVLILSLKDNTTQRKPAIVILHSSYKCKEWLRPLLEAYASRGYVAVAIDSRYHGERASNTTAYKDALVSAWKNGDTMPFIYDTVWDLIKLADYLVQREDVDPARIGITGESLGGMHAWFAAAADERYSVVVPIIGVQGFRWALDNDKWHARAESIKPVFEAACKDLGKDEIDKEVVEKVWERIAPGLASQFDAPYTVPAIAPRPLLILNGAEDPRCPLSGLDVSIAKVNGIYEEANCKEKFKFIAEAGVGHYMTVSMVEEASLWFDKFLK